MFAVRKSSVLFCIFLSATWGTSSAMQRHGDDRVFHEVGNDGHYPVSGRTLTGGMIYIHDCSRDTTVRQFKQRIAQVYGIPAAEQRIIFRTDMGGILPDNMLIPYSAVGGRRAGQLTAGHGFWCIRRAIAEEDRRPETDTAANGDRLYTDADTEEDLQGMLADRQQMLALLAAQSLAEGEPGEMIDALTQLEHDTSAIERRIDDVQKSVVERQARERRVTQRGRLDGLYAGDEDAAHLRQKIQRRQVDLAGMELLEADDFFGSQEAKDLYVRDQNEEIRLLQVRADYLDTL